MTAVSACSRSSPAPVRQEPSAAPAPEPARLASEREAGEREAGEREAGEREALALSAPRSTPAPTGDAGGRSDSLRASEASGANGDASSSAVSVKLERPLDLGPAAPSVVASGGVWVRTQEGDVEGVAIDPRSADPSGDPRSADPQKGKGARPSGEHWAQRGPPPVVTPSSHVYWVAHGKLLRRAFHWAGGAGRGEGEPPETLATDAIDGARAAADSAPDEGAPSGQRDLVAYIARPAPGTDELTARLWVEGVQGTSRLSGDGAGGSSVALAPLSAGRFLAVTLDARSAMSPVHAMTIEFAPRGAPHIGPDVVVFVGPSPEGHAEVTALSARERGAFAFIPFSRDTSSFGLAALSLGNEPRVDVPVRWKMYPAGLDPAPVGAAQFCHASWLAYVRPSASTPSAPSVLVVAPFDNGELGAETPAAEGFDFRYVSLAPRDDGGAWLAWVANGRTWVRGLRVVHGARERGMSTVGCE